VDRLEDQVDGLGLTIGSQDRGLLVALRLVIFPLTFIANTFVPAESLPTPLRIFAEWNPVSTVTQAASERFGNIPPGTPEPTVWPLANPVLYTLSWVVVTIAVFAPLAVGRYPASTDHELTGGPSGRLTRAGRRRKAGTRAYRYGADTSATRSSRATSPAALTSPCTWCTPSRTTSRSSRRRQSSAARRLQRSPYARVAS
jgi:hypothetical protein